MHTPVLSFALLLVLAGCSSGKTSDAGDPYSGLDPQIVAWRGEIEASHPACATKVDGKGCEGFEVTCKGARELTAADHSKGVSARIVSAMRFSGRMTDGSTGKAGSAFAEFTKTGGQWKRTESDPVNPTTCAAF